MSDTIKALREARELLVCLAEFAKRHALGATLQAAVDAKHMFKGIDAALAAQERAEPVAYLVYVPSVQTQFLFDSLDDMECIDVRTNHEDAEVTPLYANPPAAQPAQPAAEDPPQWLPSSLFPAWDRMQSQMVQPVAVPDGWRMRIAAIAAESCDLDTIDALDRLLEETEVATPKREPLTNERTPMDRFENEIRQVGVVAACEWFGHAPDSDFTKTTIKVMAERANGITKEPQ